eukprot:m.39867 g.39867  ORF g.39867 m.39867 type:complete len:316 (+) comp12707_c0_seq1:140-1087(+)
MAHTCSDCGKHFTNVRQLHRHQKSHAEVLPYACDACDSCFHRKDGLLQHRLAAHPLDGKPQFPCRWCKLSFKHRASLLRHVKKAHPKEHSSGLQRSRRKHSTSLSCASASEQHSPVSKGDVAIMPLTTTMPFPFRTEPGIQDHSMPLPLPLSRQEEPSQMPDLTTTDLDFLNEITEELVATTPSRSPPLPHVQPRQDTPFAANATLNQAPPFSSFMSTIQTPTYTAQPSRQHLNPPSLASFGFDHTPDASHATATANTELQEQALAAMVKPLLANVIDLLASKGPQAANLPELAGMLGNPALLSLLFPADNGFSQ